jgi:hypothetical protein
MAEFITKKENTRRLAIIIVCVLADAICAAVIIYAYKELSFLESSPKNPKPIPKLVKDVREARAASRDLEKTLLGYGRTIGWKVEAAGSNDRFSTGEVRNDALQSFLSAAARPTKEEEAKGVKSMLQYLGINNFKRWDDLGAGGTDQLHLTRLFEELLKKENEFKAKIGELEGQIKTERDNEKKLMDDLKAALDAAQKELDGGAQAAQPAGGAIGDLIRLMKEINQLQKAHSDELTGIEKDAIDSQTKATETKNENVRKRAAAELVKADLKRRIYAIQHHRLEAAARREPDGEILGIDENRQIAFINLLRQNRLWKGTRFYCYSSEKGGTKLDKGYIEVAEVRENVSSICAIQKVYDTGFPLKVGDKIYNELYEGGRPRNIAFAGRFGSKLSNEEAAAMIRAFGDHYQDKADETTNYVVVADGYEDHANYKAALEYGIKVLREKILYDYLGVK